jgi:EAL domain-containing protein (putative c-di-GMP-specific phosphodiesterase class I)
LSVDDFGTGYASMSYLQRLPVQEVKIDQSFIRFCESSDRDREIISSVVHLAHRLGMLVVAEGVENEGIETIITELGCDRGQGYHYAKALDIDEFIVWWRSRKVAA